MLTDGIGECFLFERVVVLNLKDLIILTRLKVILEYLEKEPSFVFPMIRPVVVFLVAFRGACLGVVVVVEVLPWKLAVVNH